MEKLKLSDCTKRKLDDMYIVLYAIKNELNIKKADQIEKIDVYTLIGVNKKGIRELVGIYQDRPLNNRYWLDTFESIRSRGLKTVLFLSVDDNKNMKRTAKIAFPMIKFVDSLTYIVPKFNKYIYERDSKKLMSKMHNLYTQKTVEDFKIVFDEFKGMYNNIIHQKLIEKYLKNLENYYKYSYNIRILLFKHSANVNIYDSIRLSFDSNRNYISTLDEIYDKLEGTDNYFGFISFNKREWTLILNDLMLIYPDIEFI